MKQKRQLTSFGLEVRKKLLERNMTQVELAELLGTNKQYVYKMLTGYRGTGKYRDEIIRILGMDREKTA